MQTPHTRWIVALAVLGASLIGALVVLRMSFALYRVPSGSMIPTLAVDARVWANRWSRSPDRGDVIVFALPENPEQEFVKRVIAVEGDTLEVHDGHPTINGWVVPSCRVGPWSYEDPDLLPPRHEGDLYVEFLGTHSYLVFLDAHATITATGPFVAKPDDHWVLGDNRFNSHDSPMWFGGAGGGVPRSLIRGRVSEPAHPKLPRGAESLKGALDDCLSKRPAQTTPRPRG